MSGHGPRGNVRVPRSVAEFKRRQQANQDIITPCGVTPWLTPVERNLWREGSPDQPPRGVGLTRHREEEKSERWRQAVQMVKVEMNRQWA